MERYEPLKIEQKWKKIWFDAENIRNYTIVDILMRFYEQQGLTMVKPDFRFGTRKKRVKNQENCMFSPLELVNNGYGVDTVRVYSVFVVPYDRELIWELHSVGGVYRFLNRCWNLIESHFSGPASPSSTSYTGQPAEPSLRDEPVGDVRNIRLSRSNRKLSRENDSSINAVIRNKTIKKVTEDIHRYNFNTAVAGLMEYVNELYKTGAELEDLVILAKLLKPFAPHLASEMLERLDSDDEWPKWDEKFLVSETVELLVQMNGKLRARLQVNVDDLDDEDKIIEMVLADEIVKKFTESGVKKTIFVKKAKLVSIVV